MSDRMAKLERVYAAARGLVHGTDWNKGTAAIEHGYRAELIAAVDSVERHPNQEAVQQAKQGRCYDCGHRYGGEHGFPDLVVANPVWSRIAPVDYGGGGLLCPSCMCKRLYWIGVRDVPAAFMSGPIRSVDPELMSCICWSREHD